MIRIVIACSLIVGLINADTSCFNDKECGDGECCDTSKNHRHIIMSKRFVHLNAKEAHATGTCKPYKQLGDHCKPFDKYNGYCSCAKGTVCDWNSMPGSHSFVEKRKIAVPAEIPGRHWELQCIKS